MSSILLNLLVVNRYELCRFLELFSPSHRDVSKFQEISAGSGEAIAPDRDLSKQLIRFDAGCDDSFDPGLEYCECVHPNALPNSAARLPAFVHMAHASL